MNVSIETTVPQFNDALTEFIRFNRISVPQGLRQQGQLLGKRVVQFTPAKTLAQGRAAVARDIRRAVEPLNEKDFKKKGIKAAIRKRDYSALELIFSRFKKGHLSKARVVPFSPDLHQSQRDRRGRVTSFKHVVTPDEDVVKDYIEKVQRNVGEAKGGWADMVLKLAGALPSWISSHASAGEFEDKADDLVNGYIRQENKSRWASYGDEDRIVAEAIRSRTSAIIKSIQHAQADALRKALL